MIALKRIRRNSSSRLSHAPRFSNPSDLELQARQSISSLLYQHGAQDGSLQLEKRCYCMLERDQVRESPIYGRNRKQGRPMITITTHCTPTLTHLLISQPEILPVNKETVHRASSKGCINGLSNSCQRKAQQETINLRCEISMGKLPGTATFCLDKAELVCRYYIITVLIVRSLREYFRCELIIS